MAPLQLVGLRSQSSHESPTLPQSASRPQRHGRAAASPLRTNHLAVQPACVRIASHHQWLIGHRPGCSCPSRTPNPLAVGQDTDRRSHGSPAAASAGKHGSPESGAVTTAGSAVQVFPRGPKNKAARPRPRNRVTLLLKLLACRIRYTRCALGQALPSDIPGPQTALTPRLQPLYRRHYAHAPAADQASPPRTEPCRVHQVASYSVR